MSEIVNTADEHWIRGDSLQNLSAMLPFGIYVKGVGERHQPGLRIPVEVYLAHLDDEDIHALAGFLSWFGARLAKRAAGLGNAKLSIRRLPQVSVALDELRCALFESGFFEAEDVDEKRLIEALKRRLRGRIGLLNPSGEGKRQLGQKIDQPPVVVSRRGRSSSNHPKSSSKKRGR